MSSTQIIAFDRNGDASVYGAVRNSWLGGMAIWTEMEYRHLPRYIPEWISSYGIARDRYKTMSDEEIRRRIGYVATRCSSLGDNNGMHEIWELYKNQKVPDYEQITLLTTLDGVVVMKEYFDVVIMSFKAFGGKTNLPEQIDILRRMMNDDNVIACAWNQSSVDGNAWTSYDYCKACEECEGHARPYNLFKDDDHWIMFEGEEQDNE